MTALYAAVTDTFPDTPDGTAPAATATRGVPRTTAKMTNRSVGSA